MKGTGMYIATWSGGKDSCLACYKAIKNGLEVSPLVHFIMKGNLHGVPADMIRLQTELTGIPVVQRDVSNGEYEQRFKAVVSETGARGVVFGDIYLEEHRSWLERVCRESGVKADFPIWGIDTREIMNEFIAEGFETIVVSAKKDVIDNRWIGHKVNKEFMNYLEAKPGVDVCGENGEYHTFVTGGPLFKGNIDITSSGVIERDNHWFLDIKDFRVN